MDYYLGKDVITKHVRPVWTIWNTKTVHDNIKAYRRRSRRVYKQYLKTGDVRDFNRSQVKITSWYFD